MSMSMPISLSQSFNVLLYALYSALTMIRTNLRNTYAEIRLHEVRLKKSLATASIETLCNLWKYHLYNQLTMIPLYSDPAKLYTVVVRLLIAPSHNHAPRAHFCIHHSFHIR